MVITVKFHKFEWLISKLTYEIIIFQKWMYFFLIADQIMYYL